MLNKNKEINKSLYWKYDSNDNMMYSTPYPWNGPYEEFSGHGDALCRTALAYITYKDKDLKVGILNCFRKFTMINYPKKYWYQASRCSNRYREDDVSRDQIILALSALKINNDIIELKEITRHLPYRLSRRFKMTPIMWSWINYLKTDKKIWAILFNLFNLLELIIVIPLTKILRKLAKVDKTMPVGQYIDNSITKTFWYKVYDTIQLHGYALNLKAWEFYIINSNDIFGKISRKLMLSDVEDDNYAVRLLLNDRPRNVSDYKSTSNWRPSIRFNGDHDGTVWYLKDSEIKYNQMDKDLINLLYKNA